MDRKHQLSSDFNSPDFKRLSRSPFKGDFNFSQSLVLRDTPLKVGANDTTLRQVLQDSLIDTTIRSKTVGESLDEALFEIFQSTNSNDVLDTLSRVIQACCDSLELVDSWDREKTHNSWLSEETNTWRLLYCLYSDSLIEKNETENPMAFEPSLSQQKLVGDLFQTDTELRLLQLLVDWLEACAAYEDYRLPAVGRINSTVHWENTLHHLLSGASLFDKKQNASMITCIDPDAFHRQKKQIHALDQQDDKNLCKRLFTEIRCGRFDEAISLCVKAGQPWRAAALMGRRLLHYRRSEGEMKLHIEGNPSRDLWKWCCMGILGNTEENIHYRGAIGALCGHLPSMLQVCDGNWEDLLWANLNVQIEIRVDRFLREHFSTIDANSTPSNVLELLQAEHQPVELSLLQVMGNVNALMNGKLQTHYQITQRHLIMDDVVSIMQESLIWVDLGNKHLLRFLAHLVLILRIIGKDPQHAAGDKILRAYVCHLIQNKMDGTVDSPKMIAYYTAAVPESVQVELFADYMQKITGRENRSQVITAGLGAGLDVETSARITVKRAINLVQEKYMAEVDETFTLKNTVEEQKTLVNNVINSLEWLTFRSGQLDDIVWMSNAMVRMFIFIGDTDAAATTLSSINQILPAALQVLPESSPALREHLCLKAYLEAVSGFASWYRHYIAGQPKSLEPLAQDVSFADKVYYEQKCAEIAQQQERWKTACIHKSKQTKSLLYNVLLFPGGWLLENSSESDLQKMSESEWSERIKQLETLRKLCIPEIVILLFKVLQSGSDSENHVEAIRLADLIASENRSLYKVFPKDKLREVLHRITESSLFVLENGRDSLGYENSD